MPIDNTPPLLWAMRSCHFIWSINCPSIKECRTLAVPGRKNSSFPSLCRMLPLTAAGNNAQEKLRHRLASHCSLMRIPICTTLQWLPPNMQARGQHHPHFLLCSALPGLQGWLLAPQGAKPPQTTPQNGRVRKKRPSL